nr:hypothetical protein [uncultured Draconibacterium sp.]
MGNIIFVYAGSIGLHSVVKEIGRPKLINDIESLLVGPLIGKEPSILIRKLTLGATLQYSDENIDYLLAKIEYHLPYFIQLMIAEIDQIAYMEDNEQVSTDLIDRAFDNVIKNTASFDDWVKRLKEYQKGNYPLVNSILTHCAHKGKISIQEVHNLAEEMGLVEIFKDKVDELVQDGYLIEEKGSYSFLSPFLKHYWLHKNPILK